MSMSLALRPVKSELVRMVEQGDSQDRREAAVHEVACTTCH